MVSAARGVSYLWLQNIVSSVARVVAFAFFARLISVDQMGVFTILSLANNGASALAGLGLYSVVTKFVAEDVAQGKKVEAASAYYKSLLLSELASIIVAAGFLLSKFPVSFTHCLGGLWSSVNGLYRLHRFHWLFQLGLASSLLGSARSRRA